MKDAAPPSPPLLAREGLGFYFRFVSHYASWLVALALLGLLAQAALLFGSGLAPGLGTSAAANLSRAVRTGVAASAVAWFTAMLFDWRVVEAQLSYGEVDSQVQLRLAAGRRGHGGRAGGERQGPTGQAECADKVLDGGGRGGCTVVCLWTVV